MPQPLDATLMQRVQQEHNLSLRNRNVMRVRSALPRRITKHLHFRPLSATLMQILLIRGLETLALGFWAFSSEGEI
ncbi:MAG: hypothetical protein AVDCRST_MAG93-569 [uncultured Chloroflexia bacterium]|uniref:Uncharacterized protein n=1 Tax=uncultured Chloroflexia bacterium TaxID=1672391 RepID=A0A6J4HGF3_9CHLR|nr:MAG: hypothetical protein AVDCRST_MAG93-569 [uncultured Chloroflexia bacterium]